jgi:galactose mutarotase-like enzyme
MRIHSLENKTLRIEIIPEQGGHIESLVDRRTGKNWVWHPEGYLPSPHALPVGAPFDDNRRGGWEEVFPNDAAGEFQGYSLVDHGELWSQPWKIIENEHYGIKMSYRCERVPVDVEKTIVFSDGDASFRLHYRFKSRAEKPLPYLFKLHPAIAIEPGDELLLPPCVIKQVSQDLTYVTELAEGWAGVRNVRTATELKIRFDLRDIPNVGAFESFGKLRNPDMLVLAPGTNVSRAGAVLHPGKQQEYHFEVRIDPVSSLASSS